MRSRAFQIGLEDAVGETKRHDILDCVLAEKVVDPENLVLMHGVRRIWEFQSARQIEAMSERLFDHHPAEAESAAAVLVLALIGEFGFAQLLHDGTE